MTLKEFLNSPLLPRREETPDLWSRERYWALPEILCVYSFGFNHTTYDKQSKLILHDLRDMNPTKYHLLEQVENYEVKGVTAFPSGERNDLVVHIMIDISNEDIKRLQEEIEE